MTTAGQGPQPLRRRLFGYAPAAVDRALADVEAERRALQAELDQLRAAPPVSPAVSGHLAALLQSFAETVADGQKDAEDRAARIVADAEERAAQIEANALLLLDQANEMVAKTYADAASRYEEVAVARQDATDRIGEAVARLAEALAVLGEVPEQLPAPPVITRAAALGLVPPLVDEHAEDPPVGGPPEAGPPGAVPFDAGSGPAVPPPADGEASEAGLRPRSDGEPLPGGGPPSDPPGVPPAVLSMVRPHPAA